MMGNGAASAWQRGGRWRRYALMATLVSILCALAGCGAQQGGSEVAFLSGDGLWVAQADGSHARELARGAIVSFAWSPDHHEIVFRTTTQPNAGAADAPGLIEAVSINGGFPLQLTPPNSGVLRGGPWWDGSGSRIIYRERAAAGSAPLYVVSQVDQPVGIARKPLAATVSLPALSADGRYVAALDLSGALRVGTPGQTGNVVAQEATLILPGTNRPARPLWRPGHNQLLYEAIGEGGVATLRLLTLRGDAASVVGQNQILTQVAGLLDAAFSPDGALLLTHSAQGMTLWDVASGRALWMATEADPLAQPWWAPDSKTALLLDAQGASLLEVASGRRTQLLDMATAPAIPPTNAFTGWSEQSASPWSADGSRVTLVASGGARWRGALVPAPKGAAMGVYQANPYGGIALIGSGAQMMASWSALDPACAFLAPVG